MFSVRLLIEGSLSPGRTKVRPGRIRGLVPEKELVTAQHPTSTLPSQPPPPRQCIHIVRGTGRKPSNEKISCVRSTSFSLVRVIIKTVFLVLKCAMTRDTKEEEAHILSNLF